jgi:hypothetical protein
MMIAQDFGRQVHFPLLFGEEKHCELSFITCEMLCRVVLPVK